MSESEKEGLGNETKSIHKGYYIDFDGKLLFYGQSYAGDSLDYGFFRKPGSVSGTDGHYRRANESVFFVLQASGRKSCG